MKRLVLAISMLVIAISVAVSGRIIFCNTLDSLQNETIYIMKKQRATSELKDHWEKNEVVFGLMLCDEKYKNLEKHIMTIDEQKGDEFQFSCREILFEIEEIRKSQLFLIENIL